MHELSRVQRIARRLTTPAVFAAMEDESRRWRVEATCGHATNVWETGGIRYKARGRKHTIRYCPTCRLSHRFTVRRVD